MASTLPPKKVGTKINRAVMAVLGSGALTLSAVSATILAYRYGGPDTHEVEQAPDQIQDIFVGPPAPVPMPKIEEAQPPIQHRIEKVKPVPQVKVTEPTSEKTPNAKKTKRTSHKVPRDRKVKAKEVIETSPVIPVEQEPPVEEVKVAEPTPAIPVEPGIPTVEVKAAESTESKALYTSTGWLTADFEECPSEWKAEWTDQGYVAGLFVVCENGVYRKYCEPLNQKKYSKINIIYGSKDDLTRVEAPYDFLVKTPNSVCQKNEEGSFSLYFGKEKSGK